MSSPQLHYLDHQQNNSYGKNCYRFANAPRFPQNRNIKTQFKYNPEQKSERRYCNFGYGSRSTTRKESINPAPNHYNVSFRKMNRPISIGLSRDKIKFGSIRAQIARKLHIPAPGKYNIPETLKQSTFTMKQKLPDDVQIKLRNKVPGPGYYESTALNESGKYPSSNNKNVRYIIMDANKKQPQKQESDVGPGSYDLFNKDSSFSHSKVEKMRNTYTRAFGTDKRKGPQYRHKLFVPGPGLYETFSSFGTNYQQRHFRSVTEGQ